MKKTKTILFAALIMIMFLSAYLSIKFFNLSGRNSDIVPPIKIVAEGGSSGHKEKKNYIIDNQKDWERIWNITYATISPKPTLPLVDFNKRMIIAVFLGQSGGGAKIPFIRLSDLNEFVVSIENKKSGSSCTTPAVITHPFQIVETIKTDKNIKFVEEEKVVECK